METQAMKDHHRDTAICALIAGGCGFIANAALFGPWEYVAQVLGEPWCYGWAAAIATASVGLGAFRYAREAHLLRMAEVTEARQRTYRLDLAAFNEWRNRIIAILTVGGAFKKTKAKFDLDKMPLRIHLGLVRTCVSTISPSGVVTTHFALSPEMLGPVFGLDGAILFFRSSCESFIARHSSLDLNVVPPSHVLREFYDLMEVAVDSGNDAQTALDAIRPLRPTPP